jgi:hypothetical protein
MARAYESFGSECAERLNRWSARFTLPSFIAASASPRIPVLGLAGFLLNTEVLAVAGLFGCCFGVSPSRSLFGFLPDPPPPPPLSASIISGTAQEDVGDGVVVPSLCRVQMLIEKRHSFNAKQDGARMRALLAMAASCRLLANRSVCRQSI